MCFRLFTGFVENQWKGTISCWMSKNNMLLRKLTLAHVHTPWWIPLSQTQTHLQSTVVEAITWDTDYSITAALGRSNFYVVLWDEWDLGLEKLEHYVLLHTWTELCNSKWAYLDQASTISLLFSQASVEQTDLGKEKYISHILIFNFQYVLTSEHKLCYYNCCNCRTMSRYEVNQKVKRRNC